MASTHSEAKRRHIHSMPYFGFDVAEAIAIVPGTSKFYIIDGFGGLYAGNGAAPGSRDALFRLRHRPRHRRAPADGVVYALDGFGGVHVAGSAPVQSLRRRPISASTSPEISSSLLPATVTTSSMASAASTAAGIRRRSFPRLRTLAADIVRAAVLAEDDVALLVLDGYGGVHAAGGAGATDAVRRRTSASMSHAPCASPDNSPQVFSRNRIERDEPLTQECTQKSVAGTSSTRAKPRRSMTKAVTPQSTASPQSNAVLPGTTSARMRRKRAAARDLPDVQ